MILKAKEKHLNDLTSLHRLVLGDTSSSKFGHEFVKNLYKTLIRYDGARVWIICNNREVFGFISVCNEIRTTTKWIKTNLKTKHYLSLIKIFIFHPKEIFNLLERIIFDTNAISKYGDYPSILTIGISPDLQGKGEGKKLIYLVDRYFKEMKYKFYFVDTLSNNLGAIRFYESAGFKRIFESNGSILFKKTI